MSSDDLVHRIGVLESRVGRVCKFLGGMYWYIYLEEFKSLEQKVVGLDKSLDEKISEMNDKMEKEFRSKVDELEAKMEKEFKSKVDGLEARITEEVSVINENLKETEKEKERKKGLAKEIFSIETKDNVTYIKVKDKNIEEVSEESLGGLPLIMKVCDNVSLYECFDGCKNLTALNFPSTFNTSNVTSMYGMFRGCSNLSSVDLSTFNTSNVTSMERMFSGCSSLSSLDLSTFNTNSVGPDGSYSGCTDMFKDC